MNQEACCTCAKLLNSPQEATSDSYIDEKSALKQETKSTSPERILPCCGRAICSECITKTPRFATYCPYCQVTNEPSALPQGLRDPPAYSSPPPSPKRQDISYHDDMAGSEDPPAYTANDNQSNSTGESSSKTVPDVIHHLARDDTIASLSLAYNVPATVLRQHNSVYSDHLLSARRTISIPSSHYRGESLSPNPIDDPEESERKANIRKFMVGAKCHKYEEAELYLKQSDENVDKALEQWREDEKWEKENPYNAKSKAKVRMKSGGGLSSQLL